MKHQVITNKAVELEKLFSILTDKEMKEIIESAGVNFVEPERANRVDYLNAANEADPTKLKEMYIKVINTRVDKAIESLVEQEVN